MRHTIEFVGENSIKIVFSTFETEDVFCESVDSQLEREMTSTSTVIKSLFVVGALMSSLFSAGTGVQAKPVNQNGVSSFIVPTGTNPSEGRFYSIGNRNSVNGDLRRRVLSTGAVQNNTSQLRSSEPHTFFENSSFTYSSIEKMVKDPTSTLNLSEQVSIHIQSAYVSLKKPELNNLKSKGGFLMSDRAPTYFQLYAEELATSLKNQPLKLTLSAIGTAVLTWLGVPFVSLITGLLVIAVLDLILGLIPGNSKPGTESDQKIQAKFISFTTNFLALLAFTKGGEYLKEFTDGNFYGFISNNLHYFAAVWIFSIYSWRLVGYVARANKTKIPKAIKKLFDNDVAS
ncbi:hypothetical protein Back11_11910 [Paenibacillus baekrokdamisoli]|uniref:Uncharacterized protein n=1 Tax=Paenibacillus baekrokdamisoli TaxID=1712516 RepID=A0A3G9INF7_9BACL|nr:hypothetical protein [Paenibacillus baekrokdamisoli]MBB3070496.1 hypothetical protein [Paenibacillus baekrokdamisoli]BBH19846.1 hypothetical protein Back11_11910 [Paenibacillus baekrokdamisoli]